MSTTLSSAPILNPLATSRFITGQHQFLDCTKTDPNILTSHHAQPYYPHPDSMSSSNAASKFCTLLQFINPEFLQQFLLEFQTYAPHDLQLMQSVAASLQPALYEPSAQAYGLTTPNRVDVDQKPHSFNAADLTSIHPVRPPSYATDPSSRQSVQSLRQLMTSQRSSIQSSRSSWIPQTPAGAPSEADFAQQIWPTGNNRQDGQNAYHESATGSIQRLPDIQEVPNPCTQDTSAYISVDAQCQPQQQIFLDYQQQAQLPVQSRSFEQAVPESFSARMAKQHHDTNAAGNHTNQVRKRGQRISDQHRQTQPEHYHVHELANNQLQLQRQCQSDIVGFTEVDANYQTASSTLQQVLPLQYPQPDAAAQYPAEHPVPHSQEVLDSRFELHSEVQPHFNCFQSSELPLMPPILHTTNHDSPTHQLTPSAHESYDRGSATPMPSESANMQRTHNFRHVKPHEEKPKHKVSLPCPDACGTFQTVSELKKHVTAEHERNLIYHCNHCHWESFRREQWGRHRQKHDKNKRHLNQPCTESCMSIVQSKDPPVRLRRACAVCFKLFDKFETWFDHHVKHFSSDATIKPSITLGGVMKGLLKHPVIKDLWRNEMSMHGWSWHSIDWQYQDELFQKVRRALESDMLNGHNWTTNDHGPQTLVDLLASCARSQTVTMSGPIKTKDEKQPKNELFPSAGLALETISLTSSPRKLKKAPSQVLRTKQSFDAMSISEKSDVSMRSASRIPIRSGSTIRRQRSGDFKATVRPGRSPTMSSNSSL